MVSAPAPAGRVARTQRQPALSHAPRHTAEHFRPQHVFFDAGNDTFKSDAQLREQLLTTWRTGGKIDRRHRNLLLHSKLLANLTHQQEQPRPEHTVDYTTPEYFGSERDVDH